MLVSEEIVALGAYLKEKGFPVALPHILSAQRVVQAYVQGQPGADPNSLARLTTLLRPIFCSTPEHQQQFDDLYLRWVRQRGAKKSATSFHLTDSIVEKQTLPAATWKLVLVGSVLLILAFLTFWFHWHENRTLHVKGRIVAEEKGVEGATVVLGEESVSTDTEGKFSNLPFQVGDVPIVLSIEKTGFFPRNKSLENEVSVKSLLESRAWLYLKAITLNDPVSLGDIALAKLPPPPPTVPPPTQSQPSDNILQSEPKISDVPSPPPQLDVNKIATLTLPVPPWWKRIDGIRALLVALPVLLAMSLWLYRLGYKPRLERQASRIPPALRHVEVRAGTQVIFPTLALRSLTQRLRQPQWVGSHDLDR